MADRGPEAYPGELAMLRGVLGVVRVIAQHGDIDELRRVVAEHYADERDAYAAADEHTVPDRMQILRQAIRTEGGQWTTRRVHKLYRGLGVTGLFRSTVRHDLAALHREGLLALHEEPGRRFYTPTTKARA